jgi:hypothetical protein
MAAFWASILITLTGFAWFCLSTLANEPRIRITSPVTAAGAPALWRGIVYLQPHKDNRVVIIEADGQPGEYHQTSISAPGEGSWKIRQVPDTPFRLNAGCYVFRATVKDGYEDDAKVLARAETQRVAVIDHNGYPCPDPRF